MTGDPQSVPVPTPGVTGSVTVGSTFIVLDVVQPSSRKILWSAAKNSGRSWSTNTAVSGLVKEFRKFLEEQGTAQVSEYSRVPVTNLGINPNTATQCIAFGNADRQSTPPELYQIVAQCIQNNDYPNAVALFVLAGMDTRFDVSRIADNTDCRGRFAATTDPSS